MMIWHHRLGTDDVQVGNPSHRRVTPQNPRRCRAAKKLAALYHFCLRLSEFCARFQVAGLDPSTIPQAASSNKSTTPPENCALTRLYAGSIYLPDESMLMVTQTLLHIFPRLDYIGCFGLEWLKVSMRSRFADDSPTVRETRKWQRVFTSNQ